MFCVVITFLQYFKNIKYHHYNLCLVLFKYGDPQGTRLLTFENTHTICRNIGCPVETACSVETGLLRRNRPAP